MDLTAKINGPNGTQKRKAIVGSMAKIQESAQNIATRMNAL
jgi:hypothetical protein